MKKAFYFLGRALQLLALLVVPSAIWAGEYNRSEAMAIGIFVSGILAFGAGYLLTQMTMKL